MQLLRPLALLACLSASMALAQSGQEPAPASAPMTVDEMISTTRRTGAATDMSRQTAVHLGIPLRHNEQKIDIKGRAFNFGDGSMRMLAVPADQERQYLVLIARKNGVVRYFVTTPSGRLQKAVINRAGDGSVQYVTGSEVERSFRDELEYWEQQFPRGTP